MYKIVWVVNDDTYGKKKKKKRKKNFKFIARVFFSSWKKGNDKRFSLFSSFFPFFCFFSFLNSLRNIVISPWYLTLSYLGFTWFLYNQQGRVKLNEMGRWIDTEIDVCSIIPNIFFLLPLMQIYKMRKTLNNTFSYYLFFFCLLKKGRKKETERETCKRKDLKIKD